MGIYSFCYSRTVLYALILDTASTPFLVLSTACSYECTSRRAVGYGGCWMFLGCRAHVQEGFRWEGIDRCKSWLYWWRYRLSELQSSMQRQDRTRRSASSCVWSREGLLPHSDRVLLQD